MFKHKFTKFLDFDGAGAGTTSDADSNPGNTATGAESQNQSELQNRTFTQEDLNRIVIREKERAQRSVLRDLGFDNLEDAKGLLSDWRAASESNASDIEKAIKAKEKAEIKLSETNAKLEQYEQQILLLSEGVKPDKITKVGALVNLELENKVSFEEAISSVKKEFPSLFIDSHADTNTGSPANPPKDPSSNKKTVSGIGKRLAENKLKQSGIKVE